jgi:hypothetical protein
MDPMGIQTSEANLRSGVRACGMRVLISNGSALTDVEDLGSMKQQKYP